MAAKLADLRKKAKGLGIPPNEIRGATSASELQEVIDNFSGNGSKKSKATKKSAVKKAVAKKATGRKSNRKSSRGKSAPAAKKSTKGKAKRPTTAKARKASSNGDSGRFMLDGVDYSVTDGWNPREDSPPDRIIKALRAKRGNREKVFETLLPDIWDFMGRKKRDGSKRSKSDAEAMLRYRISRTAWEFAMRTGQHEASPNRVIYGEGGTGQGVWKPAKAKRTAAKRSPTKRGREVRFD
jgi:hypothetical protein